MLIDEDAPLLLEESRKLTEKNGLGYLEGSRLEPVQIRALEQITENYRLRTVASTSGLSVVQLVPRVAPDASGN